MPSHAKRGLRARRPSEPNSNLRRLVHDVRNSVGSVQLRLMVLERSRLTDAQREHIDAMKRALENEAALLARVSRELHKVQGRSDGST